MNLCSNNHDEICYEGLSCPACELLSEIKDLKNENEDLQKKVDELEDQIDDMRYM